MGCSFWGLREQVVGIDMGDGYLCAVHAGCERNGRWKLINAAWHEGEVASGDHELARQIRQLWRTARFSTRTVRACLRAPSLLTRYFRYEHLDEKELPKVVRLEAEASLQLPPSDIALDWFVRRRAGGPGTTLEGLLVAVPRQDLDRFVRVLREAGLYPVAVDTGAAALLTLARAVQSRDNTPDPVCLVHAGAHSADLGILTRDGICYARSMTARSPGTDKNGDFLIHSVCENLKYVQFKLHGQPASTILVTGRPGIADSFARQLQAESGLAVTEWNPLQTLARAPRISLRGLSEAQGKGGILATAFALSVRGG